MGGNNLYFEKNVLSLFGSRLAAILLFAVGMGGILKGCFSIYFGRKILENSRKIQVKVLERDYYKLSNFRYTYIVEINEGTKHKGELILDWDFGAGMSQYGGLVDVYYNPAYPERVLLRNNFQLWVFPISEITIGISFFLFGIKFVIWDSKVTKRKKGRRRLET